MGRAWLCVALGVCGVAWAEGAPEVEARAGEIPRPAQASSPSQAESPPGDEVLVLTGLGAWVNPEAALRWNHALGPHLGLSLGVYGAWNRVLSTDDGSGDSPLQGNLGYFTLSPGMRFVFARGLFAELDLPIGVLRQRQSGLTQNLLNGGIDAMAGFRHVFEGGLLVEVYAGPAVRVWRQTMSGEVAAQDGPALAWSSGVWVGVAALRCGVGVGYAW